MGQVSISINDRSFKLGCDDGEEQHLLLLADHLARHVENLKKTVGRVGDEQLYLMAGLMVCDELWDARDLLIKAEEALKREATQGDTPPVVPKAPQPARPSASPLEPQPLPSASKET